MRDSESALASVGCGVMLGFGYLIGRLHERGDKDAGSGFVLLLGLAGLFGAVALFYCGRLLLAAARQQQQPARGDGGPHPSGRA